MLDARPAVLFVGDLSLDSTLLIPNLPEPDGKVIADRAFASLGGVAANSAVACGLAGARPRLAARIGTDPGGAQIEAELARYGVRTDLDRRPGLSMQAICWIDGSGEKRLVVAPGVGMYPSADAIAAVDLDGVSWVHTVIYDVDAARVLARRCAELGVPLSIDLEPNSIPADIGEFRDCLSGAAAVFVNNSAQAKLDAAGADLRRDYGVARIVRSLGSGGARIESDTGVAHAASAALAPAVDTTGAGDCLAGWLIAELLAGVGDGIALSRAVTAATLSCASAGAAASFPSIADVDARLALP